MRNKWCKYVLMSAVVLCGITAGSMKQGVFAQEVAQPKEIAEGAKEDLQWQLKQMEESMQKQQEQIQALKNRVEEVSAGSMKQGVVAQEVAQPKEIAEGEKEDLQWQLKQMEESMQRQQEQIQALKNRVGEVSESVSTGSNAISAAKFADIDKIVNALKGIKIGGLWYLSYQNGETGNTTGGASYNAFNVKRGYLTVEKEFFPWFSARFTSDVTAPVTLTGAPPPTTVTSNLTGSLAVRIKYLYAQFNAPDIAFLTKPYAEVGVVPTPWQDFEEKLNYYRCQDTMFIERNGITNSADYGLTFATLLGGFVDEKYQKEVNAAWPGRYGSIQAGIYNGGGYTAGEANSNKALEGRVTVRPLPDIIPGLQLTYFAVRGKGNITMEPVWNANLAFASFEHKYFVLTGQYFWGTGLQSGVDAKGQFDANDRSGYSFFTELKPHKKCSVIGRFDHFNPNTNASNTANDRYIAGVAYHIDKQHKNMILLDYDTVKYELPGKSDDRRVQLTWQVAF